MTIIYELKYVGEEDNWLNLRNPAMAYARGEAAANSSVEPLALLVADAVAFRLLRRLVAP
jgi:hypothetical protein